MARIASRRGRKKTNSILDGWQEITKSKFTGELSPKEKVKFEKARLTEELNKRSTFVLGGQIDFLD